MVFRSDLIFKLRESYRDFPPNVLPILSGGPELQRFRTFPVRLLVLDVLAQSDVITKQRVRVCT